MCCPLWLLAQPTSWGLAGGSFALQSDKRQLTHSLSVDLNLNLGLFLTEKWAVGGGLNVFSQTTTTNLPPKDNFSLLSTGNHLFSRYYFSRVSSLHTFATSTFRWSKIFLEDGALGLMGSANERINHFQWSAGLGADVFLTDTKDLALETVFSFNILNRQQSLREISYGNSNFEFTIGLQYFPERGKSSYAFSSRSSALHPALEQDGWMVGGGFQYKDNAATGSSLTINPGAGYFLFNRFAISLASVIDLQLDSSAYQIGLQQHVRYFLPIRYQYFFLEGGLEEMFVKAPPQFIGKDTSTIDGLQLCGFVSVGFGSFLSEYVAIEGKIQYNKPLYFYSNSDYTQNELLSRVRLSAGVVYYLHNH